MRPWNRFTGAGHGDRPNHRRAGLSMSGSAAPAIPARTASFRSGGATAAKVAIAASPARPSLRAIRKNCCSPMPWSPQCGYASSTKCDATPSTKAGTGLRAAMPISTPDRTWFVTSTSCATMVWPG